ncbi:MAG: hypothetical protein LKH27_02925 [Prevotella sp.]|nr:hypothetical protein [Prevotella sp.]MCH3986034.1 hypothetical protein [Prevotella sp.]MCH3991087.1 hypothetical protein [Prevotella sp.]MCH4185589.1 hypothetical protein [Prevotella sp.]MCH4215843.1 hypothetical protein [Prevotella sp.]MCI1349174.1 hypothetical protein [Prevotella sp.]
MIIFKNWLVRSSLDFIRKCEQNPVQATQASVKSHEHKDLMNSNQTSLHFHQSVSNTGSRI